MDLDEQFIQDADEVQDLIFDEVFPILMAIEDDYPEQSAFFSMFISLIHTLYDQGWTKEDLLREVTDHHEIFLKNEMNDVSPEGLH